jgi:AraC-like DNA-binding protein
MQLLKIFRFFYLLGAVNALFFCVLIFSKKNIIFADKILGLWLIILAAQLIIPFLYLTDINIYYKFAGYEIIFFAFHPVLLYFYILSMTGRIPGVRKILLSSTSFLICEIAGLSFFIIPAEERFNIIKAKIEFPVAYFPFLVFMIAYFSYYVYNSYKSLQVYKISILQIYSYRENIDLLWLRRLVVLFSAITIIVFPTGLISYFYFHSIVFADYLFYLMLVIFIFLLGYWGYQQGEIFSFQTAPEAHNGKENNRNLIISGEAQRLFKQKSQEVKQLMIVSKPYLNPKLTIHDLANGIDVQPHQLSRIINQEFHSNFFEFVNSYRVEEFKNKVRSGEFENFTILGIALECGFNSKSSFNRIFKESTGITPGDYMRHRHNQKKVSES